MTHPIIFERPFEVTVSYHRGYQIRLKHLTNENWANLEAGILVGLILKTILILRTIKIFEIRRPEVWYLNIKVLFSIFVEV